MKPIKFGPSKKVVHVKGNYLAVCYLFEGIKYQDYCEQSSFNESTCLDQLPNYLALLGAENDNESFALTQSSVNTQALQRYQSNNEVDFPNVIVAIQHYWLEVFVLCLLSAVIFHILYKCINWYRLSKRHIKKALFNKNSGFYDIGKISFDINKVIGKGNQTVVYSGKFENTLECAVKRISSYSRRAQLEIEFLRTLSDSPYLVRYFATETDEKFIYIALNLAEFTLADVIDKKLLAEETFVQLSKTEICRQTALGLQHLHQLGIAHRDLKPQNILVSFPDKASNRRRVMISDFGLSKYLDENSMHSKTGSLVSFGTLGWMAPEVLEAHLGQKKESASSKSSDIFSLGCVFYFTLSDGLHPFGKEDIRQLNIIKHHQCMHLFYLNDSDTISGLNEELAVMATHVIESMISFDPDKRPPISYILKHPLFWSKATQLNFLMDVSDLIDKNQTSDIARRIERFRQQVVSFDWTEALDAEVCEDIKRFRSYKVDKIRDLLRVIRNKRHHYNESSDAVKRNLGNIPDGLTSYFTTRFPRLLPYIYAIAQYYRNHILLKNYFEQETEFESLKQGRSRHSSDSKLSVSDSSDEISSPDSRDNNVDKLTINDNMTKISDMTVDTENSFISDICVKESMKEQDSPSTPTRSYSEKMREKILNSRPYNNMSEVPEECLRGFLWPPLFENRNNYNNMKNTSKFKKFNDLS